MNEIEALLPATATQSVIAGQLGSGDTQLSERYVQQTVLDISGPTDPDAVHSAWNELGRRHQALRSELIQHEGRWVQAIFAEATLGFGVHDLSSVPREGQAEAIADVARGSLVAVADRVQPGVRLDLVLLTPTASVWAFTYLHTILDGASLTTLLAELGRLCTHSLPPPAADRSLVAVTRRLHRLSEADARRRIQADLQRMPASLPLWPSTGPLTNRPAARMATWKARELIAKARSVGVGPASLIQAVVLDSLARVCGRDRIAIALTVDLRSLVLNAESTLGMLVTSQLIAAPYMTGSVLDLAQAVQRDARHITAHPAFGLREQLSALEDVAGAPDVLLTLQGSADLPDAPYGLVWGRRETTELTEFALTLDAWWSDEDLCMYLQYDQHRVDEQLVDRLMHDLGAATHDWETRQVAFGRAIAAPRRSQTQLHARPAFPALPHVLAALSAAAGCPVREDTPLGGLHLSSLLMMGVSADLAERGLAVSLDVVASSADPRALAALCRPQPEVTVRRPAWPTTTRSQIAWSPLEQGLLDRTHRRGWGVQPMREQSRLDFVGPFDSQFLRNALDDVSQAYPALTRSRAGDTAGLDVAELRLSARPQLEADRWLRDRLTQVQLPTDPLLQLAIAPGQRMSSIALDWHNVLLDGWSFGTFVADLQKAYLARQHHQPFRASGINVADLAKRLFVDEDAAREHWASALVGVNAIPVLDDGIVEPRRDYRRRLPRPLVDIPGVTPDTALLAILSSALAQVTSTDDYMNVAVRANLRPPDVPGALGAVGMLTGELPVVLSRQRRSLDSYAIAFAERLREGRAHGLAGERPMRQAVAADEEHQLWSNLVVFEEYLLTGESAARGHTLGPWVEAGTWRRQTYPALRALIVQPRDGAIDLCLSTASGRDSEALLTTVCEVAMTIAARGHVEVSTT